MHSQKFFRGRLRYSCTRGKHVCGALREVNLEDLGPDVWIPPGIKILCTPVGSQEFIQEVCEERLQRERELWEAVPWVPDLQCAWQVLLQCAGPRCHHLLRTLAPESSQDYAVRHDDGMFETMETLLHGLSGGGPAAPDWSPHCNAFNACGMTTMPAKMLTYRFFVLRA